MPIPTAPFGSTGHESSRVLFGAAALGAMSQARADATMDLVHAAGINHIDTAAGYGESEVRLAPWLAEHRNEVFLATKTGERSGDAARAQLEASLERMGVDQVDLIQLHNLVEEDDWETAHAPGGALEALIKAQEEGLTRFIGVTGHGVRIPGMHLRSLERHDYASVLFPLNFTMLDNPAYRTDVESLIDVCVERGVAMQTIKSLSKGRWAPDSTAPQFSWYEPIEDPDAIARATRYVLGDARLFLNTTSDARKLPAIFEAASGDVSRPSDDEMQADTDRLGITPLFDGSDLERI